MRLLVLDTETTGLDPNVDRVIEIAAALYDTDHATTLWQMASLVPGQTRNPAKHVNGISEDLLLTTDGFFDPFEEIAHYARKADAIVAHNVEFDRPMIANSTCHPLPDKPWVCTYKNITFPRERGSRQLAHLAADHGISTVGAHRAMADVLMVVELLKRVPDLEMQIRRAMKPQGLYAAVLPYERKDEAKSRGYSWNKGTRRWEKWLPIDEAEAQLQSSMERPFPIRRIG